VPRKKNQHTAGCEKERYAGAGLRILEAELWANLGATVAIQSRVKLQEGRCRNNLGDFNGGEMVQLEPLCGSDRLG